ncbi:hypothetical protein Tco_1134791 [Tanacetum coccineum]
MSENKDKYHDTILDLEARAKKNKDIVLKFGNSLQGMFMLGPKPMSFYDSNLKHGLGYANPYTLKKAISQNPKLYDASCFTDSKIHVNIRDTEDILDDATKSQTKMKNKLNDPIAIEKKQNVCTIDYKKLNALYEDFVPQKEFSAKQKYFSSSENSSNASLPNSSFEIKQTVAPMPSANPMKLDLNKMENEFKTLFALLQTNSKRESSFYTSPEEIRLTKFLSAASSIRRPLNRDSPLKNSVLSYTKKSSKKVEVSLGQIKRRSNKKIVTDVDVQNTLKGKDVLCVSCAKNVVQIVMWIVVSGCSKHMIGDRSLLKNLVEKFKGIVRFRNDHFATITGYGDYVQGNIIFYHVYYVEGLGHTLFGVGKFCDGDLEVAFRSNTCFVRNLEGDDLLTGAHESNLYTISISKMVASSHVCLLSKSTSTKSWLSMARQIYLNS